ncbi:sensor histidine kinase [Paenibacillus gansuensis]|uniref:Sensor histidine kinase n=1 Tax=Paenibacillus gansuensis TaxID=306542 RepID=A0ABW5P9K3_9BACL
MAPTLTRIINDMKLRTKLFVSFIFVVFVPVLIVGLFLTVQLREMALGNAEEQTAADIQRVKVRTSELLNVAYDSAYRLANDSRLERIVNRKYETVYDVVEAYRSYPDFKELLRLYKEISGIRFYMDNPTMLNNWEFLQPDKQIMDAPWYRSAQYTSPGIVGWDYIKDERDGKMYLSLVQKVSFYKEQTSGVLVININMALLNSILKQETFDTMIVDDNGKIIASNRAGWNGSTLDDIGMDRRVISETEGIFRSDVDGQASQMLIEPLIPKSSYNSLRIVSVLSIGSAVKDANRINRLALTVVSAGLIIAILLIYAVSTILSKRMLKLSKHINKVATGNLEGALEIDGKDEIAQLSRQFNAMVQSIQSLMTEVQESNRKNMILESKQNEIKLKMMASQINPHFLFNTLESIRMKAHLKGEREISQIVGLLGKLMRKNLEAGRRKTALSDELTIVRCYLEIQKFRYEDRLHYKLEIDPEAECAGIPPLIIQPLVENAVIHGLEGKEEGGTVTISVQAEGDRVHVSVADDGTGMGREQLDKLRGTLDAAEEEEQARIGLRNVHTRLKLSYAGNPGLDYDSIPGKGTKVRFTIPWGGDADEV